MCNLSSAKNTTSNTSKRSLKNWKGFDNVSLFYHLKKKKKEKYSSVEIKLSFVGVHLWTWTFKRGIFIIFNPYFSSYFSLYFVSHTIVIVGPDQDKVMTEFVV